MSIDPSAFLGMLGAVPPDGRPSVVDTPPEAAPAADGKGCACPSPVDPELLEELAEDRLFDLLMED